MSSVCAAINDLFEFEGKSVSTERPDDAAIGAMVQRQFQFLPQPIQINISEKDVTIRFTDEASEAKEEAKRLGIMAGKRAAEGEYQKAVSTLKRVLELDPSLHIARRDLAMSYIALGDTDNANNQLIDVLRLNPKDHWAWVALGILYIRHHNDLETGERFLRRALEIAPNDPWTLNSLGGVLLECGQSQEAAGMFNRKLEMDAKFANAYFGLAMMHLKNNDVQLISSTMATNHHNPFYRTTQTTTSNTK